MLAIAHFGIGVTLGIILLYALDKSKKIKNKWLLKYDLFVILGFGLFAMIPDIGVLFGYAAIDNSAWANLFCFHAFLDTFPDDALTATKALIIPLVAIIMDFRWVKKLNIRKR